MTATPAETDADTPSRADVVKRIQRFEDVIYDRIVTTTRQLRFGHARLSTDLSHVFDLNHLMVDRPVAAVELLGLVEEIFLDAGLAHREIQTRVAQVAWTLVPALFDQGWSLTRLEYMAHDRATAPAVSPLGFREVDIDTWADHATAFVADNEWGRTEPVQRDMAARDRRLAARIDSRFILSEDFSAGCHIYRHGQIAQIEQVHVLSDARGQGLGLGLMAAALAACDSASIVFLVADAEEWPRDWYARLGFTAVASAWEWLKLPAPPGSTPA
ncbi:MAG: GNAT family N-acetyltransferase [Euzebya sp.]